MVQYPVRKVYQAETFFGPKPGYVDKEQPSAPPHQDGYTITRQDKITRKLM